MIKTAIDALFAGVMIAIGAMIYLSCANAIAGAFLFAIGLVTIILCKFNLYTGKVGYARTKQDIYNLFIIFIMNAVGCAVAAIGNPIAATGVILAKLATPLWISFIESIICGILIFIAVNYKDNLIVTILAVAAFIVGGFEHSIANIAFLFAAHIFSAEALVFIIVVALGNALGSLMFSLWLSFRSKLNK